METFSLWKLFLLQNWRKSNSRFRGWHCPVAPQTEMFLMKFGFVDLEHQCRVNKTDWSGRRPGKCRWAEVAKYINFEIMEAGIQKNLVLHSRSLWPLGSILWGAFGVRIIGLFRALRHRRDMLRSLRIRRGFLCRAFRGHSSGLLRPFRVFCRSHQ